MRKVGHLSAPSASFEIYLDEEKQFDRYRLYQIRTEVNKYGYPTKRKKLLAKYTNAASCTAHITDLLNMYGGYVR